MGIERLYRHALAIAALAFGVLLAGPVSAQPAGAGPATANETLEAARDDLRISRVTFDRVRQRFYELLEPENFDPAVLADYAVYMEKVGALMERQQRIVAEMEAIAGVAPAAASDGDWPAVDDATFDPGLPVTDDALARLDRELDASLAKFDQFLLDEQYEAMRRMRDLDDASSGEMTDLAREAAAAVERLRDRGIDVDTKNPSDQQAKGQRPPGGGAGGSDASGGGAGGQQSGGGEGAEGQPGGGAGQGGEQGASGAPGSPPGEGEGAGEGGTAQEGEGGAGEGEGSEQSGGQSGEGGTGDGGGSGSGSGGSGGAEQPPGSGGSGGGEDPESKEGDGDRPPADDDDIVARQLREAAERETDPELKKKLWEEYDRYKGTSGGSA